MKKFCFRKFSFNLFAILFFASMLFSSCKKDNNAEVAYETGAVTDFENNVYQTIKIGNQWWMMENLRSKFYSNGVPIKKIQQDSLEWSNDSLGCYCLYNDDASSPGLLYNGFAISNANNIAPAGWHVPTDEDWKVLEKFLGMTADQANAKNWRGSHEGEKLKTAGTQAWTSCSSTWPTNESGFAATAGGSRLFNGVWGQPGLFASGFWWTSTNNSPDKLYYRNLDYKEARVFRSSVSKKYGFSVRCVKN